MMDTETMLDVWTEGYGEIDADYIKKNVIMAYAHSKPKDIIEPRDIIEPLLEIIQIIKDNNCYMICYYIEQLILNYDSIQPQITKLAYQKLFIIDNCFNMYSIELDLDNDHPIIDPIILEIYHNFTYEKYDIPLANSIIDHIKKSLGFVTTFGERLHISAFSRMLSFRTILVELNKKLRKGADIISRKITLLPIGEDYEKVLSEKDALIESLQGISNITSAELSEKDAIIATLQHKCQTLTENLQSSKEELYQTNADHDTIITELECKCLELTMTISEKDAIISQHVVISEEEVELKASSIYYRLYPDYIDSI